MPPIHPGEILLEDFLKPMDISQNRVAMDSGVPAMRINKIVRGERGNQRRYGAASGALFWHVG